MSSTPASAMPDTADLLPGRPELQIPASTIALADANLYRMMDQLAASDILHFDRHLQFIERIAAVQEKLLGIRKAIFQLDCAITNRKSGTRQTANQPPSPPDKAQSVPAAAAPPLAASPAAPDSPNQPCSLNLSHASLERIASIQEIAPLAPLSSGFAHSPAETSSSATSSAIATPAVTATPATPATAATPACSVNHILDQLSQAIAGIDQISSELECKLEKAATPGAAPASAAAPAAEQIATLNDAPASTNAHQLSTPASNHGMPSANPPSPNLISDA